MAKFLYKFLNRKKKGILTKKEMESLLDNNELILSPLLERSQIGEITIDLRIGLDFLTCIQGREAFFDTTENSTLHRPLSSHFTETRRQIGETFLFHPTQTVLFSTLEYIKLPPNVFGVLSVRSSYSRLGLSVSTIVQPGYCGCISVEITNAGATPVKVMIGARFLQIRLYRLDNNSDYFSSKRKYICQVRPLPSKANEDEELSRLKKLCDLR